MRIPGPLLAFALAGWASAHAATLHVPAAYPTVGAALAVAASGDTVRIAPGRYPEYGLTLPGGVELVGEEPSSGETWFDGASSGIPVLTVPAGASPVTIRRITFRFGNGGSSGAVQVEAGIARHTVVDCVFDRCTSRAVIATSTDVLACRFTDNTGGGLSGDDLQVLDCTFRGNEAGSGGALWTSASVIERCRFENNAAAVRTGTARGGAVRTDSAVLRDCVFVGNSVKSPGPPEGGAVYSSSPLTLERCTFVANRSTRDGGAVWLSGQPSTVRGCRFLDNTARRGGAVYCSGISLTVEECSFAGNGADQGGAVYGPFSSIRTLTLRRTVIQGGVSGGAVATASSPAPTVEVCDIFANVGGDWTGPLAPLQLTGGNFSADALFCDEPAESLFVWSASPLLPENNPAGVAIGAAGLGCEAAGVVVSSTPPGIVIEVDGQLRRTPVFLDWAPGSVHTLAAPDGQEVTAGTGYVFVSWSDGGERVHEVTTPAPPAEFRAMFEPAYLLTMLPGHGGATAPPSGWHPQLASVPIHAIADVAFRFTRWTGSGTGSYTGTAADAVVTMRGPLTQTAAFDSVGFHPLTMIASAGGTVSPGSGLQGAFSVVPILAVPDAGFTLHHWIGTGSGSFSGEGAAAQVRMNGPITQTAYFATIDPTVQVEIRVVGEGETFPPSGIYPTAIPINMHAVPAAGYTFDRWLGEGTGSYTGPQASAQVIPLASITQTAYFAPGGVYPLTVTATTGGVVSPASGPRAAGAIVGLAATPATGFRFVGWQGTGLDSYTGPDAQATIAMHGAITQHAVFELDGQDHGYEFSISASDTDPFRNTDVPAGGLRQLHLWLTCSQLGIAAFECGVQGTLPVFGFTPAPGVFNFGSGNDLLMAIDDCSTGETVQRRLGAWTVWDTGGSLCATDSETNAVFAAVDCGSVPSLWWRPLVRGFSSSGLPPCLSGTNGCGDTGTSVALPAPTPGATGFTAVVPNPFRGSTELRFALAAPGRARLAVYDVAGRLIRVLRDDALPAGHHAAAWNGRTDSGPAAGGVYFVRFEAGEHRETKRVVLLGGARDEP